jgi:peptidoglycan hydrolase-like protein with peptidoglycan-binding domain
MKSSVTGVAQSRRRSMILTTALAVTVVISTLAANALGPRLRSPTQAAADAAPPSASMITATAQRRVLAEPIVLRGKVQPGASVKLLPPVAAVGPGSVITKVVAKEGKRVEEGQVLLERTGQPMFPLVLPFPLYRDIKDGMRGPDVTEVQRALRRLGYVLAVSGTFDARTQQGVARFYADRGYPEAFAEASTATGQPFATPPPDPTVRPTLAQADVLLLDRPNRRISTTRVRVGDVLSDPKVPLLDLDQAPPVITAVAARDQASLLRPGQAATASDDLAGAQRQVEVSAVGTRPVAAEDGQNGFEIRLAFKGAPLGADGNRSVRVDIQAAAGAAKVLAVPVSAVFSRADGSSFVTVAKPGGATNDVTITTGQVAGGWVEVRGVPEDVLASGTEVVVGEQGVAG